MRPKLIVLFIFAVIFTASAQQSQLKYKITDLPEGEKVHHWFIEPGQHNSSVRDSAQQFIVRFKVQPDVQFTANGRIAQTQHIEKIHEQFFRDLQKIEGRMSSARSGADVQTVIHFQYKKTLNAVAITTSTSTKREIEKLDYVRDVIEDKKVKAIDIQSNDQINATKVWTDPGVTGKNIRIGIVDTGIDYFHEDLGGGIGQSFKVKGGYDFVNQDDDPMDDNGHGTHVAGIAAANGPGLTGVAPDADLYAFKVLDNWGSGQYSWILAAIERVVDPDQDPLTDDAMDVVNMSLGGPAEGEDPLSEAVNNAVLQGVVFVVAAGNSNSYQTIGTPGVAEKAITVGATDQYDFTASFSSKGPTANTFLLKPDVSAPGVQIYSSFPGNVYESHDGTSMASPHVAGAVALLLESHPHWTPDRVKGALMNTAKNSHEELVWHQGTGRIDVYDAIQSEFVMSPGSISLGLSDPQQAIQEKTQRVTLHNLSDADQSFTLQVEGESIGSHINVSILPSNLTIPAHSSADIDITFGFDASTLPFKNFPECYSGNVVAASGASSIKVPFALIHSPVTNLTFSDELPGVVVVAGVTDPSYFKVFTPATDLKLLLPAGTYDVIAQYPWNHFVIKENITPAQKDLNFSKSQADNVIVFRPLDENGDPLSFDNASGTALLRGMERNVATVWLGVEDTFRLSDNTVYKMEMKAHVQSPVDPDIYYDVTATTPYGIVESAVCSNNPSDFTKLTIINPSVNEGDMQDMIYYDRVLNFTTWDNNPKSIGNPFIIYLSQNDLSNQITGSYANLKPQNSHGYAWETASWNAINDKSIVFSDAYQEPQAVITNTSEFTYNLGGTLPRLFARPLNHENKIALTDFPAHGVFNRHLGEHENGSITYELRSADEIVRSGVTSNRLMDDIFSSAFVLELEEEQGPYTLVLNYDDYAVAGRFGAITSELQFNTTLEDKNSPGISSLYLEVDGESTNRYEVGETAQVRLKMEDKCGYNFVGIPCFDSGMKSVSLFLRKQDTEVWEELSAVVEQGENIYSLPEDLEKGYYSLKIMGVDLSDNSLTYQLDPAFLVGEVSEEVPYKVVNLLEPIDGNNTGLRPHFSWSEITEASSYHLQVAYDEMFSDLLIDSTLNTVSYIPETDLDEWTSYYWRVKAFYESGESRWSHTENFLATDENWDKVVTLISPTDGDLASRTPRFLWTPVEGAISYILQVSFWNNFEILSINKTLESNEYSTEVPLELHRYFLWRVKPVFPKAEGRWSEVSGFSVAYEKPIYVDLISPQNFEICTSPIVSLSWEAANVDYYQLEVSGDSLFNENYAYSNFINSHATVLPLKPDEKYFWRVRPDVLGGEWSEVFQFLTSLSLEGISPLDRATNQPLDPYFSWNDVNNVNSYIFQLSENPEFTSFFENTMTSDPHISLSFLRPNTDYYWHFGVDVSGDLYWSDTYNFRTMVVTNLENEDDERFVRSYPNPFSDKMQIEIYSPNYGDALFTITDLLGNIVNRQHINLEDQSKQIVWDGTDTSGARVSDGIYIGSVETSSKTKSFKIVIKRN